MQKKKSPVYAVGHAAMMQMIGARAGAAASARRLALYDNIPDSFAPPGEKKAAAARAISPIR